MRVTKDVLTKSLPLIVFILLILASAYFDSTAVAQTSTAARPATLAQIKRVELEKLERGKQVQLQIEEIDDRRIELVNEYRSQLKHNAGLEQYNNLLRQTIESQRENVASLQQQIDSVRNLDREIVPLMVKMLDALENFVALDVPFLAQERAERIAGLRELLRDGNFTNSEKYRRILEAYQIENDYGHTIEAYDGVLQADDSGASRTVTFLKVGRLAFMYQTLDGSQTYAWSQSMKAWQPLDDEYNARIKEGIKMAREQLPPDLMFIPVEAPPVSSTNL